jgi:hypothetical protein
VEDGVGERLLPLPLAPLLGLDKAPRVCAGWEEVVMVEVQVVTVVVVTAVEVVKVVVVGGDEAVEAVVMETVVEVAVLEEVGGEKVAEEEEARGFVAACGVDSGERDAAL